jgi:hypothetical protein
MRSKRTLIPGSVDALEDRLVLSHGVAVQPALLGSAYVRLSGSTLPPTSIHQMALNGTLTGSFTNWPSTQATGPSLLTILKGAGIVSPLGNVAASGSVTAPVTQSPTKIGPQGTVTLTNSQGSLTVQLSIPVGQVYTRLSMHFDFSIVKGTGAFAGAAGKGTADLALIPQGGPITSNGISQGSFTLTLHSTTPTVVGA